MDRKKDISVRIKELKGNTSIRQFAMKIGLAASSVNNYLKGGVPALDVAYRMAKACNVTLNWLATGEEEPRSIINNDRLRDAIQIAEETAKRTKVHLNAERRAHLASTIYTLLEENEDTEGNVDMGNVISMAEAMLKMAG